MVKRNRLTAKQRMFVMEYLVDLNATQAAARAGYSKHTAMQQGQRLLTKPCVQDALREVMMKRVERTQVTADMVVKELAKIGFSNMKSYARWGPGGVRLKNNEELTEDETAVVSELSETTMEYGGSLKFKLHDKKGALELLGRHLGIFNDKLKIDGAVPVKIVDNVDG